MHLDKRRLCEYKWRVWRNTVTMGEIMSFRGIEFTPEMRKLIVNTKHFFSKHKKDPEIFHSKSPISLTALAMGIGEASVQNILAAFNKNGDEGLSNSALENRGRPQYAIESSFESIIRELVRECNKNGRQVTVDILRKHLNDNYNFNASYSTMWRALLRWGFEFGKGVRSAQLKESVRVVVLRRQYLRVKLANRNSNGTMIRPEVYLDESYVNKNHSKDDSWFIEEESNAISKPTGKGDRLIIVNAITGEGWVPNAKYVFQSKKKTTDYHASMNWNVFSEWFENKLLPNIPDNSIIIMDNAQYHNVLSEESFPQKKHNVFQLRNWLYNNKIPWAYDMLKEELYQLCRKLAPKPEFALDKIAAKMGHTILRTPPYHPELQPIEICWAVVKDHVAKHNDFTMETVKRLLEDGFNKVDKNTITGIIKKVREIEDRFWEEDSKTEEKITSEIIDDNIEVLDEEIE